MRKKKRREKRLSRVGEMVRKTRRGRWQGRKETGKERREAREEQGKEWDKQNRGEEWITKTWMNPGVEGGQRQRNKAKFTITKKDQTTEEEGGEEGRFKRGGKKGQLRLEGGQKKSK